MGNKTMVSSEIELTKQYFGYTSSCKIEDEQAL